MQVVAGRKDLARPVKPEKLSRHRGIHKHHRARRAILQTRAPAHRRRGKVGVLRTVLVINRNASAAAAPAVIPGIKLPPLAWKRPAPFNSSVVTQIEPPDPAPLCTDRRAAVGRNQTLQVERVAHHQPNRSPATPAPISLPDPPLEP